MAGKKGDRRQVMVPDEIWTKVQKLAGDDTTSASQIVREALIDYIDSRTGKQK